MRPRRGGARLGLYGPDWSHRWTPPGFAPASLGSAMGLATSTPGAPMPLAPPESKARSTIWVRSAMPPRTGRWGTNPGTNRCARKASRTSARPVIRWTGTSQGAPSVGGLRLGQVATAVVRIMSR